MRKVVCAVGEDRRGAALPEADSLTACASFGDCQFVPAQPAEAVVAPTSGSVLARSDRVNRRPGLALIQQS